MSAYLRKIKRLMKHEKFSQLSPILEYWNDEEAFLLDDPSLAVMFIGTPTHGGNEDIRNALDSLYRTPFPEGTLIQATLASLPDIENQLYGYRAKRGGRIDGPDANQFNAISQAIHDFYRKGSTSAINETGFIFRDYEFWFTIKMPISSIRPTDAELETFKVMKKRVASSLKTFGVEIANELDVRRRFRVLLNAYDADGWRQNAKFKETSQSTRPLREIFMESDKHLDVESTGVSIRNGADEEVQYIKSLSVADMPESLMYGQMMDLLGDWQAGREGALKQHFLLTLNIHYPDQQKAKAEFVKKRGFINMQARGPVVQYLDRLRFQNKDFNEINREIEQQNSSLVNYSLQITGLCKSKKEAETFAEELISYYERKKVRVVQDSHFTLPFFIAALPFGLNSEFVKHSSRFNQCTSKALPFMTPHMASWKGVTAYPMMLMTSRLGQVFNFDIFSGEVNFNCFVAAASGGGKSFFTGYLINNMLASGVKIQPNPDGKLEHYDDGGQVFVIDVGRSYEGVAAQFEEAEFIEFNNAFKYSLNPFLYIHEFDGQEGQGVQCLAQLKTMAAPSGKITDLQSAEMLTLLKQLWNAKGNEALIDDYIALCLGSPHVEVQKIGYQLRPFASDGYYGHLFTLDKPPINFNSRLVVLELEELKSDSHLQTVVLMSAILSIQHAMYLGGTNRYKALILDESWEYLKGDEETKSRLGFFAKFLETAFRRLRKYGASGIVITQSVLDGYQSDVGRAILDNSNWLILLKQREEAVDRLREEKAYSGSEIDFQMIKSIHTKQPDPSVTDEAYSEIYIKSEGGRQVCRLYTDRRIQLLLTTNAKEKNERSQYMKNFNLSLVEAVDAMIADENKRKRRVS